MVGSAPKPDERPDLKTRLNLRALRGKIWLSPEELQTVVSGAALPLDYVPEEMRAQIGGQIRQLSTRAGSADTLNREHGHLAPLLSGDWSRDQLEDELLTGQVSPLFWGECLQLLTLSRLASEVIDEHLACPGVTLTRPVMDAIGQAMTFWQEDDRSGDDGLALRLLRQAGARDASFASVLVSSNEAIEGYLCAQTDTSPRAVTWRSLLQGALHRPSRLNALSPLLPEGHPAYDNMDTDISEPTEAARQIGAFFDALNVPTPACPRVCEPGAQGYWRELSRVPVPGEPGGDETYLISVMVWCLIHLNDEDTAQLREEQWQGMEWSEILSEWPGFIPQLREPWRQRIAHSYQLITGEMLP